MHDPVRKSQYVRCPDIKKGQIYYLTGEFWPCGGKPVRLKRWFAAKDEWPGVKGSGAIVEAEDGMVFAIHPNGVLFSEVPATLKTQG